MPRTPTGPPRGPAIFDRLIACLWWLVFLGGVGAGAAAGVVLALWLALPPLPGLPLIAACWLGGNAAGCLMANRATAALTRRIAKRRKRIRAVPSATPSHPRRDAPRAR